MRENASDELFRLGAGNERTAIALQSEVAKIPLSYDVLDRLAVCETRHSTPHRLETFLGNILLEMRGKCAAPRLEEPRGEKLGRHLRIRDGLRLQIGTRLGYRVTPSHEAYRTFSTILRCASRKTSGLNLRTLRS